MISTAVLLVRDLMTQSPITITPETPIGPAFTAMHEKGVRHLPVVEQGRLIGVLTERDLMKALMKEFPGRAAEIEPLLW